MTNFYYLLVDVYKRQEDAHLAVENYGEKRFCSF